MSRETLRDLLMFCLLLAFGVVGRWADHAWNFTPLAAVTAFGAIYFRNLAPAILLPSAILAVSDLLLPSHDSVLVQISVHAMAIIPLALGRAARSSQGGRRIAFWAMCGLVPATTFFVVTNAAVWAANSIYPRTMAGLLQCYVQALPFYRTMLAGDICFLSLITACAAAAELLQPQSSIETTRIR